MAFFYCSLPHFCIGFCSFAKPCIKSELFSRSHTLHPQKFKSTRPFFSRWGCNYMREPKEGVWGEGKEYLLVQSAAQTGTLPSSTNQQPPLATLTSEALCRGGETLSDTWPERSEMQNLLQHSCHGFQSWKPICAISRRFCISWNQKLTETVKMSTTVLSFGKVCLPWSTMGRFNDSHMD